MVALETVVGDETLKTLAHAAQSLWKIACIQIRDRYGEVVAVMEIAG